MSNCPWSCRFGSVGLVLILLVNTVAGPAWGNDGQPLRYRDLKVYATSEPSAKDAGAVLVGVQFVNEGLKALRLAADLPASPAVGLAESVSFTARTLAAGQAFRWEFAITPPNELSREVMHGRILLGDVHARDLYLAFEGPDPPGFASRDVETLTAPATVVASYAPRTAAAVSAARRQLRREVPRSVVFALPGAANLSLALVGKGIEDAEQQRNSGLDIALDDLRRALALQAGDGEGVTLPVTLRKLERRPVEWTHDEAFRLAIQTGGVTLESVSLHGLRHGLYTLMTEYLDCHWFMPGSLGEEIVVPADRTVRLPLVDRVSPPSFFSVSGMSWGAEPVWDRRNRALIGQGRMSFGHAWHGYINSEKYPYETHPHLYARDAEGNLRKRDEGWTHTNFCTTEPEVLEIVAAAVNTRLRNEHAIVASLDPNDYAPMCMCERCVALDKAYGVENPDPDSTLATDRLLHFSREIHDRLEEGNRHKYLGILIYAFQIELPVSARPHPQHAGMICNQPWTYDHTRPFNDPTSSRNPHFNHLVKGWGELLTQLGYYDYYGHWRHFGPWGLVPKLREDLPAFHDLGGTYMVIEAQPNFALHGLNHYVAAQLAWDVTRDVDLLVDDFYRLYYGPAEGPMRAFWESMQRHQALTRSGANVHLRVAGRPGLYRELAGYLRQAQAAVVEADQRYRDRVQSARDGLKWGRLRWTIEGPTQIRLHRPETVDRLPADQDLSFAVAFLETHGPEFAELWDKYQTPGATAYWPRLTPNYFSVSIEEVVTRMHTHEARRGALQHRSDEPE